MPKVYNMHHKDVPRDAVYIGRGSTYGNPYVIGQPHPRTGRPMTRDDVCVLFERYIVPTLDLDGLKGKDLVCFCKPKRCHGDILVREANK